jgi:hypothetical protein
MLLLPALVQYPATFIALLNGTDAPVNGKVIPAIGKVVDNTMAVVRAGSTINLAINPGSFIAKCEMTIKV